MMLAFLLLLAFLSQASSKTTTTAKPYTLPIGNFTFISFPSFNPTSCQDGRLICTGSVSGSNGFLSLTPEPAPPPATTGIPIDKVGRVLFSSSVPVWSSIFYTQFTFRIITTPNSVGSGDGMSFIMASNNNSSPSDSYGSNLGIMSPRDDGHAMGLLAVVMDAYKNPGETDGNHIAIDTTSVKKSLKIKSLNCTGIDLKSGKDITVRIIINGKKNTLQISVGYASNALVKFLTMSIDIKKILPSSAYVGFTAATGAFTERHQLLSWQAVSYPINK